VSARDTLRISWQGIQTNLLRSALTVLGVMIGVSAVIILLAVGTGSSAAVRNQINALGTNTITVLGTGRFGRGPSTAGATQSQSANLTTQSVQSIESPSQAPDVASVSPVVTTTETATYGGASYSSSVIGTTPNYLAADDYTLAAGSPITQADVTNRKRVVLIGQTVLSNLFTSGENPLGQTIQIGSASFEIVGVLAEKGSSGITNQDSVVIAPYTAVQDELTGYAPFTELLVQAKSTTALNNAATEVEDVLASEAGTTVADLPFSVINEGTLLTTAQSTSSTFTTLLGAVAAISLLVGGIGVMNIMLVTVTERTREIGIRKAVGAPKAAILSQFLLEAVLLSLIGGGGGVLVGVIGSRFKIDGVTPIIAGYSVPLAFGIAIAVGVFFGLYPANRAASLRPIDALRYE
jgi:putative ABC transport system permease protein